ncbi:MAG: aldo/keto reductase [Elusimicrobiaceae bacterium]|nr:aldo/keto reductase [Elusimicrobiaceae bacterium]
MLTRCLGKTQLQVSVVSLGGWALGGGTDWGPTEFADVQRTIDAALHNGVNLMDTAPIYGNSEEVIGRALTGKRDQVIISTKCGLVKNGSWTDHDLRPETISRQLENSLRNLRTDYIDIYLIHYLDPQISWQDVLETLITCKQQGKIRHIGVCNVPADVLEKMAQTGIISCVQQELSLLHRELGRTILDVCHRYQLGFMAYGCLCGGILSGKYRQAPNLRRADARNYFYKCYRGENFDRAQQTVDCVKQVATQQKILPAQVALAWVLAQPGVTCALAGARNPDQMACNARAAEIKLSAGDLCNLSK